MATGGCAVAWRLKIRKAMDRDAGRRDAGREASPQLKIRQWARMNRLPRACHFVRGPNRPDVRHGT